MDEAAIQRVVNFSIHMKNAADLILNYATLVSIDTWTLYEVEEAFSLIFEAEKYTNFHVLPPSHREHPAIPHIQFLYDILQKVRTLRILTQSHHVLPTEQQINLKCFRSLCKLELNSVPINQLKGLQNVRPYLKHLTVTNVCSQLEDILLKCGADMATGFAWENLETANFSRNVLVNLDSSLRLLSAIKVLDLSYCQLVDAISLFCLPTISHLDLSYNKLTTMPALGENASYTLQVLNLSNNLMIDLRGIERFSNLEVLDLRENFISVEQTLVHLNDLPQLRNLNLFKNPITCGLNYRDHVLRCLNTAIRSYDEFLLDDQPLTFNERTIVGKPTEPRQVGGSSTQLLKYLMDNVTKFLRRGSSDSTGIMGTSSENLTDRGSPTQMSTSRDSVKKRKHRVRQVSMDDPNCSFDSTCAEDDFPNEEETDPNSGQSVESKLALKFPQLYNIENDDLSSLPSAPCQSDKLLDEILNASHVRSLSSSEQARKHPESNFSSSALLLSSSNSSISRLNDSLDLSPLNTDDEELEPNRELYSVICKWEHKMNDKNAEGESEFVFLSFTKYFYKEKNCLTKRTMVKLPISSLQSMEVLSSASPIKVQLNFNHTNSELSARRFIFEEEDLKLLKDLIEPIIEQNNKLESASSLPCKECRLPFYGIKARVSGAKPSKKYCKFCGNKKIQPTSIYYTPIVDTYTLFPNIHSTDKNGTDQRHKREKSVISTDSSESVSVCSSSGASACNLKRTNDVDLASNHSMSSIEVLHENFTADGEERSKGTIYFEAPVSAACNVDFRTPDMGKEALKNGTTNHVASNISEHTVMQESSSSGSMSGSVCTTVDRLSSGPSTPLRQLGGKAKEGDESSEVETRIGYANTVAIIKASDEGLYLSASVKSTDTVCHRPLLSLKEAFELHEDNDDYDKKGIVFEDPSSSVPLDNWAKNLLESYTSYSWESWKEETDNTGKSSYKSSYLLSFSFDDFTVVDHRLKLYCELFLFTENNENLLGLVKVVASIDNETPFHAFLAISNRKIYILRITSEENESPQEWLEVECFCYLEEVPSVYTVFHKQGVMIKLKDKMALLCLADSQRSNAVLYFILDCLEREGHHPCMDDRSCRSQSEELRRQIDLLEFDDLDSTVHLFQIVTLLHRNGECTNHFLVVTKSHVLLFEADLTWLSSSSFDSKGESSTDLTVTAGYNMDDVTQIELFSDNHFKLDFYQQNGSETKSPWALHVASPWVGCNFIQTVRPLWESIMHIDLDVVCYSEDLFYIKEALRDTEYSSYVK